MRGIESKFWQKLKKNLPLDWLKRVENSVETGWPDVNFLHNGFEGWIELKAEKSFPEKIDFEPAQPNWLTQYWGAGGNCYVMLYVEEENKVYLWAGGFARELYKSGGTREVKPMVVIKANAVGWNELYQMFSTGL